MLFTTYGRRRVGTVCGTGPGRKESLREEPGKDPRLRGVARSEGGVTTSKCDNSETARPWSGMYLQEWNESETVSVTRWKDVSTGGVPACRTRLYGSLGGWDHVYGLG